MTREPTPRPLLLAAIAGMFVFSGLAGLIYQSVWSQYLGLILGHAAYAQSVVLSIFMGGMALGAWVTSQYIERWRELLKTYGYLEGAIGLFGIGFHALFLAVNAWLFESLIPILANQLLVDAARYLVAIGLILPQTILLGMTFPVMSAALIRSMPGRAGHVLGLLYFLNSIGAAFGALVATFYLVPKAGLPGAMLVAGLINLAITVVIILLRPPAEGAARARMFEHAAEGTTGLSPLGRFMLIAAFVTSASSFIYEIVWVRMLGLAVGSSLHAFELMLTAFIGGLALGGLYVRRRLDGMQAPVRFVGYVQVLMGIAALASAPIYTNSFEWVAWLYQALGKTPEGYTLYNIATASIAIAVMMPAAFFAGMTLPAMTFALLRSGHGEHVVGKVYAANTLGAIAGVLLAVHVAIPVMGLKLALVLGATIDIALGIVILRRHAESLPSIRYYLTMTSAAAVIAGVLLFAHFDPRRLASGVYRHGQAAIDPSSEIYFMRDGKTASIAVFGNRSDVLVISTNGKPDASIQMNPEGKPTGDEPTMTLAALLGLVFHPAPERVANIGFGSGLTTHTLTLSERPKSITTVEIEQAMIDGARWFGAVVAGAYDDPRSSFVIDDARAYFARTRAKYDVIVSEPSNPWVSGVAKLFTQEFYDFLPRHLDQDGILIQWVQTYEISDRTLYSILAALDERFEDYRIFASNSVDLLIVAKPKGRLANPSDAVFGEPRLAAALERLGLNSLNDVMLREVGNKRTVQAALRTLPAPVNSDFFPYVAHTAPRDRFSRLTASDWVRWVDSNLGLVQILGVLEPPESDQARFPIIDQPLVAGYFIADQVERGLLGAPVDAERLGPSGRQVVEALAYSARDCFAHVAPGEAISDLRMAFQATAPFLPSARRQQFWGDTAWLGCSAEQMPAPVRAAHAALTGAVRRDWATVAQAAVQVFTDTPRLAAEDAYAFGTLGVIALERSGQPDEAEALATSMLQQLRIAPNHARHLAFLRALAKESDHLGQ